MTANVLTEQIREFRQVGMDGHIGKPIKPVELHRAIARVLHQATTAEGHREAAEANSDFDETTFAELTTLLPPDRLNAHMASFLDQLDATFSGPSDPEQSLRACHKLITQAGILGFHTLSLACRKYEDALHSGRCADAALAEARAAAWKAKERLKLLLESTPIAA
jgi:HPt (histidine-containing phosphotransfer) domain-containing protein